MPELRQPPEPKSCWLGGLTKRHTDGSLLRRLREQVADVVGIPG